MTAVRPDHNFWQGKRVLLTGHTGFKGGWLTLWLSRLGAEVTCVSLPPNTSPNLFELARIQTSCHSHFCDIRDARAIAMLSAKARPEIVFHLAAQPLVRTSYQQPLETFSTNVMGSANILDALRGSDTTRVAVMITTDKVYRNNEWPWPYRENDTLGGHDPYSASKGAAELVIAAYRRSFFQNGVGLASVRAGNVIGGGDWAADRLIPDIIRALMAGQRPLIRSPHAIRPWQHVLEALGGYLMIAQRLVEGHDWAASAWNFGPAEADTQPVSWVADRLCALWGKDSGWDQPENPGPSLHEAGILKLDCAKARAILGWRPAFTLETALAQIAQWHGAVAQGTDARALSLAQLADYRKALAQALAGKGN